MMNTKRRSWITIGYSAPPSAKESATLPRNLRPPSAEHGKRRPQTVPMRMPSMSTNHVCISGNAGPQNTPTEWQLKWCIEQNSGGYGELRKPTSIDFLKNDHMVVLESKRNRIHILDRKGKRQAVIDRKTDKHLQRPRSVCTAMDDQMLVVADYNRVALYDAKGKFLRRTQLTENLICNVASRGPNLILTETGHQRTVVERTLDGRQTRAFKADFMWPGHIAVQPETNGVCISDSQNHCVYFFDDRQKSYVRKIGSRTDKYCERQLIWPTGVTFSGSDTILVADKALDVISEYDTRGYFRFDVLSDHKDGLRCPVGLAMSRKKSVAIVEELLDYKKDHYNLKLFTPVNRPRSSISV